MTGVAETKNVAAALTVLTNDNEADGDGARRVRHGWMNARLCDRLARWSAAPRATNWLLGRAVKFADAKRDYVARARTFASAIHLVLRAEHGAKDVPYVCVATRSMRRGTQYLTCCDWQIKNARTNPT